MRADKRDPRLLRASSWSDGETYDELWNATQKEMLMRGKIHGYYRMYWGKKIIEWTPGYQEAADIMIEIHERYALDGRDPNTYTNILWCFGLHDRAWGERPIFGKMRYMSLEGMERKTDTEAYIREIRTMVENREGSAEGSLHDLSSNWRDRFHWDEDSRATCSREVMPFIIWPGKPVIGFLRKPLFIHGIRERNRS